MANDKEHLAIASSFTQAKCLPDVVLLTEASHRIAGGTYRHDASSLVPERIMDSCGTRPGASSAWRSIGGIDQRRRNPRVH
ncbi:hypothetical protein BDA96_08G195800 [Sorghum bicolor]|uniref:Uncharacterized protein n=1 Tax=Sorghum bicolor TaxID=4558 RepID=A0A921QH64_SORBI|nr:hypothetical protein BDA96_08G195800 [Sorghum bicolor]